MSDDAANRAWRAASWTASRIDRRHRDLLASFAEWLVVEVEGLGEVMFCHGSPRSDEEIVTTATTEERFRGILAGISHNLIVCKHTHAQFDRRVDGKRVVNAGSVGMPYQGKPVGAFGSCLGPASPTGAATMTLDERSGESELRGTRTSKT